MFSGASEGCSLCEWIFEGVHTCMWSLIPWLIGQCVSSSVRCPGEEGSWPYDLLTLQCARGSMSGVCLRPAGLAGPDEWTLCLWWHHVIWCWPSPDLLHRFGLEISDPQFEQLLDRLPLDRHGNVQYPIFMAAFDTRYRAFKPISLTFAISMLTAH